MRLPDIELVSADANDFTLISEGQELPESGNILVPESEVVKLQQTCRIGQIGLLLESDADIGAISQMIGGIAVIAIRFQTFADGRGNSLARLLRERYGYTGKVQAIGDFLPDQVLYMARCGFDSFLLPSGTSTETVENCLKAFSEAYQTDAIQPQPLFKRESLP